jgi:hypothetical protein
MGCTFFSGESDAKAKRGRHHHQASALCAIHYD